MMKRLFQAFLKIHVFLYRLTGGKIGGTMGGNPIVLLNTIGRKSGKIRTIPLVYMRDGNDYIITASNNGADRHPGWYYNLKQQEQATIQIKNQKMAVSARLATGETYDRLWAQLTTKHEQFRGYQEKTTRRIPLFILTP